MGIKQVIREVETLNMSQLQIKPYKSCCLLHSQTFLTNWLTILSLNGTHIHASCAAALAQHLLLLVSSVVTQECTRWQVCSIQYSWSNSSGALCIITYRQSTQSPVTDTEWELINSRYNPLTIRSWEQLALQISKRGLTWEHIAVLSSNLSSQSNVSSVPNRKCCMIGTLDMTSTAYIFIMPLYTCGHNNKTHTHHHARHSRQSWQHFDTVPTGRHPGETSHAIKHAWVGLGVNAGHKEHSWSIIVKAHHHKGNHSSSRFVSGLCSAKETWAFL